MPLLYTWNFHYILCIPCVIKDVDQVDVVIASEVKKDSVSADVWEIDFVFTSLFGLVSYLNFVFVMPLLYVNAVIQFSLASSVSF